MLTDKLSIIRNGDEITMTSGIINYKDCYFLLADQDEFEPDLWPRKNDYIHIMSNNSFDPTPYYIDKIETGHLSEGSFYVKAFFTINYEDAETIETLEDLIRMYGRRNKDRFFEITRILKDGITKSSDEIILPKKFLEKYKDILDANTWFKYPLYKIILLSLYDNKEIKKDRLL